MNKDEGTPTVAVLAFDNDKVLLVKHTGKAEHLTGIYGLPGGRIQIKEGHKTAAAREFEEETGLSTNSSDLIPLPTVFHGVIPRKNGNNVKMSWNVFVAKQASGKLKLSGETVPFWVDIKNISQLNLLPNTELAIEEGLKVINKL